MLETRLSGLIAGLIAGLAAWSTLAGCTVDTDARVENRVLVHGHMDMDMCSGGSSLGPLESTPPWEDPDSSVEWRPLNTLTPGAENLLEPGTWFEGLAPGSVVEFMFEDSASGITVWMRGLRAMDSAVCPDTLDLGPGLVELMGCEYDANESRDCDKVWLWSDAELVEPDMHILYSDGTASHELACPYIFLNQDELWCGRDGNESGSVFSMGTLPRCDGRPGMTITSPESEDVGDVLCGGDDVTISYRVVR